MNVIIADTSGLYALFDRSDRHHKEAVAFYDGLKDPATIIVIEYVLVELMTLLKSRGFTEIAIKFRESVPYSNVFRILYITEDIEERTFSIFRKFRDKSWSYTDCAIMAVAERIPNAAVFSFDHHFIQMGLPRVP